MKPLDPRLLRYARASRRIFGLGALLGIVRTLAIIAWCWCLTQALSVIAIPVLDIVAGGLRGRVSEGTPDAEALPLLVLGALGALVVRSLASWGMDSVSARGAVQVKEQLRSRALDAVDARSPEWAAARSDADSATVLGRGLDALDGYFSGYVPELILAVCATPILVATVLIADPLSGIVVCIVFPVIPIFMILIGMATQSVQNRQWTQLRRLSASFLDVVTGLPTLKIFRREQRQATRIRRETDEYRSRTMKVLRVTFLSGFVLDLAGTFSIALVAVTVGTRLVNGEFSLALGLFVLLLLPETFTPIRQVGAAFHASTEGLAASEQVFEIIEGSDGETKPGSDGGEVVCEGRGIRFSEVRIARGESEVVGPLDFSVRPGEIVALAGPSGVGKSTAVAALLGFVAPSHGRILRPAELAWCGQRPGLLQGSLADNVALGSGDADPALVRRALDAAGLAELDVDLPLGAAGSGVSGGQAQRVSIARCLYRAWQRDAGAVVLDEPTSALDRASEARVCDALRSEAADGRTVLVVSHRPEVLATADRIVRIGVFQGAGDQS